VIALSAKLDQVLQEAQELTLEELKVLCRTLLRKVAVPLQDPREFYDDWDDAEVDAAYADAW
jgi:hypothetical protein